MSLLMQSEMFYIISLLESLIKSHNSGITDVICLITEGDRDQVAINIMTRLVVIAKIMWLLECYQMFGTQLLWQPVLKWFSRSNIRSSSLKQSDCFLWYFNWYTPSGTRKIVVWKCCKTAGGQMIEFFHHQNTFHWAQNSLPLIWCILGLPLPR